VTVAATFPLTLTVRNEGESSLSIDNIVIRDAATPGLTLLNPQPAPTNTVSALGSTVWSYRAVVEPGKSWTLRIDAVASRAGELEGAVEIQSGFTPKVVPFTVDARQQR
jgi:hypothetical protein